MRPVKQPLKEMTLKPTRDDFPYTSEFNLLVLRFQRLHSPPEKEEIIEFMDHYSSVYHSLPPDGRGYADWMIDLVGSYGRSGTSRTQCVMPKSW